MAESTAIILLAQARAKRDQAGRARRLARATGAKDIAARLQNYADELEQRALELEEKLNAENHKLIEEIKDRENRI